MKLRSGILGLTLSSVVAIAAANAADFYNGGYKDGPAYAVVNWSGFYAGVNVGYGWNGAANTDLDPSGVIGGGQFGYNFQSGHFVFGVETDFEGAGISDSSAFLGEKSAMDFFGTVRGRAGYAFDRALLYATAGYAYGEVRNHFSGFGACSETQSGWVAGGGVEYKLAPNWSGKIEYQYLDLDASDPNGPGPLGISWGNDTQVHTIRVGVNYFFNSAYAPLK